MKKRKIIGIIAAASLVVGINTTFAQEQPQQGAQGIEKQPDTEAQPASPQVLDEPAGATTESFDKEKFLEEATQSGMAEVQMAKLGTEKAQDPAVKEFAQKVETDHSELNEKLKECASKKDITVSTELDSKHEEMIEHLSGLSGAEFDKAFATHMVQGHKKSIAKYKKAAASGDAEIRDLAQSALPTLQAHLTTAQKWAPGETATGVIDEPAGAAPKPEHKEDDSKEKEEQTPDAAGQTPDASPNP